MTPVTSLERMRAPEVEPAHRTRLVVVEPRARSSERSATEMWLVALAIGSAMVFAATLAKFVVDPAITTVAASSAATSTFDGP